MKKTLKNIIICICIVYFVLSIGYSIVFKGYSTEVMVGYDENHIFANSSQQYDMLEFSKQYVKGQLSILNNNINITIISLVLGVMIGLLISQKENSIVKYIVAFVLGYLCYCILWTFITILINKSVSDVISNDFIQIYYDTFFKMISSYIMFYSAVVLGIVFRNKIKVKSLNETLKNPDKQPKSENIFIIIKRTMIVLIILIVTIFIGNTVRKTIVLNKYSEKINEISKSNNYYIKEECKNTLIGDYINEIYYKDGIFVYIDKNNNSILYSNKATKENLLYNLEENKVTKLNDDFYANLYKKRNRFWGGTTTRKWGNLLLSFNVKVYSEKFEGNDYYVIEQRNDKSYIDKKSFLEMRRVQNNGKSLDEYIYEYTYEFGNVIDEDVAKPE